MSNTLGEYENPPNGNLLNLILYDDSGIIYQLMEQWKQESNLDEIAHWGTCISILNDDFSLKQYDFFKIVELRDTGGQKLNLSEKSSVCKFWSNSANNLIPHYLVQEDSTYELVVVQRTFTGREGDSSIQGKRYIHLRTPDPNLTPLWPEIPILGKYDILIFQLRVLPKSKGSYVKLFLSITGDQGNMTVPALEIPFKVKKSKKSWISLFFLFLSMLVYILAGFLSQYTASFIDESVWEKVGVIGMILSAVLGSSKIETISSHVKLGT